MNSFQLKIIATICMTIDHVGTIFFPNIKILKIIGRIAFPIFAFLMANTFKYSKNIDKKYKKLGIFAFISQIFCFLLGVKGLNILYTFMLSFLFMELFFKKDKKFLAILILLIFNLLFKIEYGVYGVYLVAFFYLCEHYNNPWWHFGIIFLNLLQYSSPEFIIIVTSVCLLLPRIYNGEYGRRTNFFYYFYPIHLAILWLLTLIF